MTAHRVCSLVAGVLVVLGACGGGGDGGAGGPDTKTGAPVLIDQIPAAVKAVESRLGGAQRYSEINATPSEVNLFVVGADGLESAYVYRDRQLEPPPAAQPTHATTFAAADIAFEPGAVLGQVAKELPHAAVLTFAVQPGGEGTQLVATVQSAEGGRISILLGPTGEILGALPES